MSWVEWTQDDNSRAELPLDTESKERFPVGFDVAFSSVRSLSMGEAQTVDPAPILFLMAADGLLCPYYVVNTEAERPDVGRTSFIEIGLGDSCSVCL